MDLSSDLELVRGALSKIVRCTHRSDIGQGMRTSAGDRHQMIQVLEGTITRDAARAPPVDHVGGGEPLNLCRHVRMLLCPTLPISLHPPECMILGLLSVPGAQVGSASGNVGARLV